MDGWKRMPVAATQSCIRLLAIRWLLRAIPRSSGGVKKRQLIHWKLDVLIGYHVYATRTSHLPSAQRKKKLGPALGEWG